MTLRNYIAGPLLAVSLASCSTIPIDAGAITNIQNAAMAACAFLPTASTIAAILGQNSPGLQTAQQVAAAICAAIAPAPGAKGLAASRAAPSVAGVPIDGRYIR